MTIERLEQLTSAKLDGTTPSIVRERKVLAEELLRYKRLEADGRLIIMSGCKDKHKEIQEAYALYKRVMCGKGWS